MVALLHQMGAHAGFIARAFERHYALAALGASAVGAASRRGLFLAAGGLEFVGVEAVPFLPPMALTCPKSRGCCRAGERDADRLGHGAALGPGGRARDLLMKLLKVILFVALVYIGGFLLFVATLPRAPEGPVKADGIVTLTGGDARLDAAVALLEHGAGKRLLISGVNKAITKDELKRCRTAAGASIAAPTSAMRPKTPMAMRRKRLTGRRSIASRA